MLWTLRRRIGSLLLALGLCTLVASGSLVLITAWMDRATVFLGDAVESVNLAQGAVGDLMMLSRADDALVRGELAARVARGLRDAERFVSTPEEREVFTRAVGMVERYRAAPTGEAYDDAFGAVRELAAINVEQARAVRQQAAAWDRAARVVGGLFAVLVPVVAAACLVGVDRWTRPVVALGVAMDRFARGDWSARAVEEGPAEVRLMSRRFNDLAAAVVQQDESRALFLAGVAHDLRNPLSALRMAASVALRGDPSDPRRLPELVNRQVAHLDRMLSDFVDGSQIRAGRLKLRRQVEDLRTIARDVVDLYAASAPGRVHLSTPDEPVDVDCDATRMAQVLGNLLSNGLKYSASTERVVVTVGATAEAATVSVADRGHGVAPDELEAIFEPFQRGTAVGARSPGAGMGLFVARKLVEAHGGTLRVEATPDVGSTFTVALPRIAAG